MQARRIDAEGGNIKCGQSGADDIAWGRDRRAAGFAALIHVAHLHLSHVHAHGHGARTLSAGNQRQQKKQGKQPSCEVA